MQMSFFSIAVTCKFDKVTDIAGTMNFVLNAWVTFGLRGTYYPRQLIATIMTTIWGARLGGFLLYRVLSRGKDERFDQMRDRFFAFLGFWIYQIVWVWTTGLPVTFLNAAKVDVPLGALDYAGWAVWFVGWTFEAIADQSKHWYMADKSPNKSKFLNSSVWAVSRHPNYFGEIMCWLGMFLTSAAVYSANDTGGYASIISPAITYLLLMYVSGIPLAEERYDQKYGKLPEYLEYKKSTSPLIPMPACVYRNLPDGFKCLFCCEYGFYSKALHAPPSEKHPMNVGVSSSPTAATAATGAAASTTGDAAKPAEQPKPADAAAMA